MSIIFGIRDRHERIIDVQRLEDISSRTLRFAPDGTALQTSTGIGMGFQPYHTQGRSTLTSGPFTDLAGNMIVFDGRLDNHGDLGDSFDLDTRTTADSHLVSLAFHRWGEKCFSRLIGDWALALWSAKDRVLYLARDHAGTRTLYFEDTGDEIRWSTYLESFLCGEKSRELDPLYVARYISLHPMGELTPYRGVLAVPPAQYIAFKQRHIYETHWSWHERKELKYRTEAEYDEHFLSLFRRAVSRRIEDSTQIVAQLSGGVDSSSIVCMADMIARENAHSSSGDLDTISYYDDSEPNWDERPYFSLIEASRRKVGLHIETSYRNRCFSGLSATFDCSLPGAVDSSIYEERTQDELFSNKGYRVIISGLGGDELLGGNPNPLPELADFLISGHIFPLFSRAVEYCLLDREPLINMLRKTIQYSRHLYFDRGPRHVTTPSWLHPQLQKLLRNDSLERPRRLHQFRVLPSVLETGLSWLSILDSLPHTTPSVVARREYRYPYLDRDLVDFLLCVPRSQMVKPGRRRYLMRRALRSIVPSEILERRRKAFLLTGPMVCLQRHEIVLQGLLKDARLQSLNLFDRHVLNNDLLLIRQGLRPPRWPSLVRLMLFTSWLQNKGSTISWPRTA